jgi:coniferyl-aldehyde dehydrogenase
MMAAMTPDDIRALFDLQYQASRAHIDVPLLVRRERLLRMQKMLDEHGAVLAAAVQADFGMRSPRLTEVADFFVLRTLLSHTLSHLARWMKPQKVRTPLFLQPAHGWIARQPLGVVGVISPWNYPVQLALAPAITALAAGNRVMLKPSELTPHTSAQLALLVAQFFAADEFCVVQGDAATAALVASLPFDHLVFTGSTAVGRKVAQAAAQHLTPTTLELGGKSPCIVDADCDMQDAALKIAHGKLLNAGQTCIAPDYVLLPRGREAEFSQAYQAAVARLFPSIEGNPDYASIITPRHYARLRTMLQQAQTQGRGAHHRPRQRQARGGHRGHAGRRGQPPDAALAGVWRHARHGADAGGDFWPHPARDFVRAAGRCRGPHQRGAPPAGAVLVWPQRCGA